MKSDLTRRLAERLSRLRADKGLTLDQLAGLSGVSRAALSRLENAEVSPSADVLDKLAHAFGMSLSRLMAMMEQGFEAHIKRDDQPVTRDGDSGFARRTVSPASHALAGEIEECRLPPGSSATLGGAGQQSQEWHFVTLSGYMQVSHGQAEHQIGPQDALRLRLSGDVTVTTAKGQGCKFLLCKITG